MKLLLALAASLALVGSSPLAGDFYVDAATGVDAPGGGSAAAPWKTIAYALGQVPHASTIHVAAGVYDAAGGEVFPLAMKPGVRVRGAGQDATVVDGGAAAQTVRFEALAFASFLADSGLERMTVRGGGNAIEAFAGAVGAPAVVSPLLRDLVVTGAADAGLAFSNTAGDFGVLVEPVVERCTIRGCGRGIAISKSEFSGWVTPRMRDTTIELCGIGVRVAYDSHPLEHATYLVARCVIQDCGTGILGTGGGGDPFSGVLWLVLVDSVVGRCGVGLDCSDGADVFVFRSTVAGCQVGLNGGDFSWIRSSIVWGNGSDLGPGAKFGFGLQEHSDLGWLPGPTGTNVNVDPLFADAAAGAFHLTPGSPVIDLGEPGPAPGTAYHDDSRDPDEDPRRLDGDQNGAARADMGADELNVLRLTASGPLTVGSTLTLAVDGPPGWLRVDAASLGTGDLDLGGLGSLLLNPVAFVLLGTGATPGSLALPVPPSAAGIELFFQSAALDAGTGVGSTSNRVRVVFDG